jgi:hypothetical protein
VWLLMATPMSAIEPVLTAVIAKLKSSTALTALLSTGTTGSVFNDVPQGSLMPYVEVGQPVETRWDTVGCYGKQISFVVKAITNGDVDRGDKKNAQILNATIGALHFQPLTITSHLHAGTRYEEGGASFTEVVSGVKVRHMPGVFRVFVTQST